VIRALLGLLVWLSGFAAWAAHPDHPSEARYLANEGVMVTQGETKIVFDPLFGETFGVYEALPAAMKADFMAGAPPFDGVDAVFVSHAHDDHFAEADMLAYLQAQPEARLYAPKQAVARLTALPGYQASLDARVTAIALERHDAPARLTVGPVEIEAVRIPHAGWPARAEVENLVFRVTLDAALTVMHLGDADANDWHFAYHQDVWDERALHAAFPPYWFFQSRDGRAILDERLKARRSIGVHVPAGIPDDPDQRPGEYRRHGEYFTRPGETRSLEIDQH